MKPSFKSVRLAIICASMLNGIKADALFGNVTSACVLRISSEGTLAFGRSGTTLSSSEPGGKPSIITIAAAGTPPQVHFAAPRLTSPMVQNPGGVSLIGYTSSEGANIEPIVGTSTYKMVDLNDSLTIKAVATNEDGFEPGKYAITATVTCQL